ncbi:unnamed protein product [Clonostachys rhizophaga]|uniref:Uncharacterized protein n=1 Tax=Clonostachys rhizophaga TaxID=160324 RepID=A0A9N9VZE6_9HYPO|nr:unnamed protein product [Clonostachys rhizophaga]
MFGEFNDSGSDKYTLPNDGKDPGKEVARRRSMLHGETIWQSKVKDASTLHWQRYPYMETVVVRQFTLIGIALGHTYVYNSSLGMGGSAVVVFHNFCIATSSF